MKNVIVILVILILLISFSGCLHTTAADEKPKSKEEAQEKTIEVGKDVEKLGDTLDDIDKSLE